MDPFAALGDPVRRALVERLSRGPARVVDLTSEHDISRPAISRHLRVLGQAGIVAAQDRGRERHYGLLADGLAPVRAWLDGLGTSPRVPEHALDALDLEVRRVGRDRAHTDASPTTASARHTKETG